MGLYPKSLNELVALMGIPQGPYSKVYAVDAQHGNDNNPGTSLKAPLLTLEAAEDLTVDNHNDAVVIVGGPTQNNLAAALVWDKSYTHLIGLTGDLPGVGQRARLTSLTTAAIVALITLSGSG